MKKRIMLIGNFGGKEGSKDGQVVKTVTLYNELRKRENLEVLPVDTYYWREKPIILFIKVIALLIRTKEIIVIVSKNGKKLLFPLLYFCVILFKKNVYHDVIGGNLGKEVERYSSYRRFLNSFQKNWVETSGLKRELEELGITNVEVIPNFRSGYIVPESELVSEYCEPYRFCTFSRVTKEKGITTAINAIKEINQKRGRTICTLDIYGAVDDAYKTEFDKLIADASGVIKYKGVVNPDDSVNVIRNYYGTLFPTLWIGEGIAGTIIESFFAGVPVLATDWRYNSEVIECGVNGITYPCEAASSLVDAIYWLISVDNILEIKKECTKAAEYYLPDDHIDKITNEIMKD